MFLDTPRFPTDISYGASGGPGYSTTVVIVNSGVEARNSNWTLPIATYDVAHGIKTQAQLDVLIAFFRNMKGKANGFRFKDWSDFTVAAAEGGISVGTGMPTYQLVKNYITGSSSETRLIKKPVSATVARNGTPDGTVNLDTTSGIVTFVPDGSSAATGITAGATTSVVLTTNPGTLVAGKKLFLTGFTGADAALVNNLAHTINSVSGAGPYTFVLATNTAGKTLTLGSGYGKKYPQASDTISWVGEFDTPCRFDTDTMHVSIENYNIYSWGQIPITEIRLP
jgi:uncharacterized protein (TIGR02217 family)